MIIDRCQSAHRLAPVRESWRSTTRSNESSISNTSIESQDTVGLDVDDDDEEQQLITRGSSYHLNNSSNTNSSNTPLQQTQYQSNQQYGSTRLRNTRTAVKNSRPKESIRFQVVVWDVGPVDVALGRVPMTFRVSMFWNDLVEEELDLAEVEDDENETNNNNNNNETIPQAPTTHTEWQMQGRRKAYERILKDDNILHSVDVPPLSLLNVVTFDVIGAPEVCVLREQQRMKGPYKQTRRLMRWTCLYKATLMQQDMNVNEFPHDEHVLSLKLGILVHRRAGGRWDMNKYRLDLATEDDSMGSTRVPHGLIVDHIRVPNFSYNAEEGLNFEFVPLSFGTMEASDGSSKVQEDQCLEVRLRVKRDSGYYDKNIMPLLGMLNIVAVCIPLSLECIYFFQRGLMIMNIGFVQIGIRMNVDKNLPSVGRYQIKLQCIMNQFFFSLLLLVMESSLVYVLNDQYGWSLEATHRIDNVASLLSFGHIVFSWVRYYHADWLQCCKPKQRHSKKVDA